MKTIAYTIAVILIVATFSAGRTISAGDAAAGKELFSKKCASCHGTEGEGKDSIAKMLANAPSERSAETRSGISAIKW